MNRRLCQTCLLSGSRHDADRTMSVSFAYECAGRFTDALRFSFDVFFGPPAAV